MIRVKFAFEPTLGDVTINFSENADMILPRLVPLAVVFSVYWLLGRKNMNSTRAIFIVIIVAILFSSLGILQKL
ncbi:PTS system mannose/fructose/sorbose family transporter subunit IID [Staphylococcus pseudintermedius]